MNVSCPSYGHEHDHESTSTTSVNGKVIKSITDTHGGADEGPPPHPGDVEDWPAELGGRSKESPARPRWYCRYGQMATSGECISECGGYSQQCQCVSEAAAKEGLAAKKADLQLAAIGAAALGVILVVGMKVAESQGKLKIHPSFGAASQAGQSEPGIAHCPKWLTIVIPGMLLLAGVIVFLLSNAVGANDYWEGCP